MYKKLLEKIKEYDSIAIFRHQKPDGDCMFSALALYEYLRENFKEKKIRIAGNDEYDLIFRSDRISDAFIRKSLVIVVDTSIVNRIDDDRYALGDYIIKIDHHPIVEQYGDLNIVDPTASACAQILAEIFFSRTFAEYNLSTKVCEYLYCGMVSDTINFRTTNTTYKTLEIAAKLAKKGELKISDLVEYINDIDFETYLKVSKIRNYLKRNDRFGYIVLDTKDLQELAMTPRQAKDHIDEIGKVKDLNVWAFAVEVNGRYDVSVRSKRGYKINDICTKYKGGGHNNAAAAKQLEKGELSALFSDLVERSTIQI